MQAAGNLIHIAVELAARMQHGQRDLRGRTFLSAVQRSGYSPAIVDDGNTVVNMDKNIDVLAETCHGLVDAVVNDLIDEMMQADAASAANIHGRTLSHCLKTLKHFYAVCSIFHLLLVKRGIRPRAAVNPSLHYWAAL